jgi:glycerate kinase
MGKGVGEIGNLCRKLGVPCIGLAGRLADRELLMRRFQAVAGLTPDVTTPEDAMAHPAARLEELANRIAQQMRF